MSPRVIETTEAAGHVDLVFVAVRLDQVDAALVPVAALDADGVVSLINLPLGADRLVRAVGTERFVPAFPGVAGRLCGYGEVQYIQIAQQPTVIGDGPVREMAISALTSARFPTKATKDMDAWLKTHAIFISAFESALAAVSGDAHTLASDSAAVDELVRAVREGFTALAGRGVLITPAALRIIFQSMPVWFATRYWCRQLEGEMGRLALAPHAIATQHSELVALQQDVRTLLGGTATPRMEHLFTSSQ